jgi:hypothetical protein
VTVVVVTADTLTSTHFDSRYIHTMSTGDNLTALSLSLCAALDKPPLSTTASSPPGSTAVTTSATSSLASTPCPSFSTPDSPTLPSIPTNQPVKKTFDSYGLSPGSSLTKDFDEVQKKIVEDGILDLEFKHMSQVTVRCIYFLYGRKYAWEEITREARIAKIRAIVDDPEARRRLRNIACPASGHLLMEKKGTFELYIRAALTAKKFFKDKKAKGGFLREPIFRFQQSANCYMPAACVFTTLQSQYDMPDDLQACKPLDVAQAGRKFAIETDKELEYRVVQNGGMCARTFASKLVLNGGTCARTSASKLVGRGPNDVNWQTNDFGMVDVSSLDACAQLVATQFAAGKYGLVTNFHVSQAFRDVGVSEFHDFRKEMKHKENASTPSKKNWKNNLCGMKWGNKKTGQLRLKYIKFDGNNIDTEGKVVHLDYDEEFDEEVEKARRVWEKQLVDMRQEDNERSEKMAQNIPEKWKKTYARSSKADDPTAGTTSSGNAKHAMVLLGTYEDWTYDEMTCRRRKQLYFMLLNSWYSVPLVLVSAAYLKACGAIVSFLVEKLGKPTLELARDERLFGETCLIDGGDEPSNYFVEGCDCRAEFHDVEEEDEDDDKEEDNA